MSSPPVYRWSLIAAFAVFAAWEGLKHLLLMDVSMWVQHSLSAVIEIGLALVIVAVALHALAAHQRELSQMREMRDRLASALANDLRQPLLSVVESLDEMGKLPDLDPRKRRAVDEALRSVRLLVGMTIELLRVTPSREAGQEVQQMSCAELLRSAVQTVQVLAAAKGVEISVHMEESLPDVRGQPHSLYSVFLLLLENAVRLTPAGGLVPVSAHETGPHGIGIRITDEGPGLTDEEHQVLEGRGAKKGEVVASAARQVRSGLQYCAAVINAHGGTIWAEASGEHGNSVTISLPAAQAPVPQPEGESP